MMGKDRQRQTHIDREFENITQSLVCKDFRNAG